MREERVALLPRGGGRIVMRPTLAGVCAIAALAIASCARDDARARAQLTDLEIGFSAANFIHHAREGKLEIMRLFLDAGMSVEAATAEGQTALMVVAQAGKI